MASIKRSNIEMLERLEIDLKSFIKYITKLFKEIRRKKIMLFSLCLAIVSGYIMFNVQENTIIDLIFIFSASTTMYNFCYPLAEPLYNLSNKLFRRKK